MIVEKGKYYLYRHIRLDTNTPFYIGIAKKNFNLKKGIFCNKYERAFDKWKRNKFWKKIKNKTNYEVEIILESDSKEFIKEKEIEFIALYGRYDLGLGTLVNLTNGGDGSNGNKASEEHKQKVKLGNLYRFKKVIQLNKEGKFIRVFESSEEVGRVMNCSGRFVNSCCRKSGDKIFNYSCKGFLYIFETDYNPNIKYSYKKNTYHHKNLIKKLSKPILQYDLEGNFIREWENSIEATKSLGKTGSRISTCILRGYKYALGYQWFK